MISAYLILTERSYLWNKNHNFSL